MATVSQVFSGQTTNGTVPVNSPYLTFGSNEVLVAAVSFYSLFTETETPSSTVITMGDVLGNPNFYQLVRSYNTGVTPHIWLHGAYYITNYPSNIVPGYAQFYTGVARPMAAVLWKIVPDAGKFIRPVKGSSATGSGTTASYADFGGLEKTNIIFGATAVADDNYFTDSDTTDGTWSSVYYQTSTAAADDLAICSQYKIVTGSATQTYNGTFVAGTEFFTIGGMVFAETESPYWGIRAK